MKIALDLCCGMGGATQAFRGREDWHVVGIDYEKKFEKNWQGKNLYFVHADVTQIDWLDLKETMGIPKVDFLWASPSCERFSFACLQWPKKGIRKALEIVAACVDAVIVLQPKMWVLENPRGRLRWFIGKPTQSIRYSDYDMFYRAEKVTDLWSNTPLPMVLGERRIKRTKIRDHLKRLHSWEDVYPHDKALRAFVPLGVSEAVYSEVQRRLQP